MELPVYPVTDYSQGYQLLAQLGSFWVNVFQEPEILQAHLRSSGHIHGQNYLDYLEAVACVSRFTVPVFHRQNWRLITVLQSEASKLAPVYGGGDSYGSSSNSETTYGHSDSPLTLLPMPPDLADTRFVLQNMVIYPSKVWVSGVDYRVNPDRHVLEFNTDPFTDPLVPRRDILDKNGVVVDAEIAFWVYAGDFDLKYVYTHFGYVLDLKMKSSEGYKELVNAVWDMFVTGFSPKNLSLFLSAMSGVPTFVGPIETVQVIQAERSSQLIVTDARVYRVPLAAVVLVSVGDRVSSGQAICDAVTVQEFSCADPDYSILPAMSLSKSFLTGNYFGELSFKNHDVAIDYRGPDENGKTIVRFETGGFPADVETFWTFVHENGISAGKTLANLLDNRPNPSNEPTQLNLPMTINPLQFVIQNLLRNNLFAIRVRQSSIDPRAPGIEFFRLLRAVIPPHTTYVVFIELIPPVDVLDLSAVGGEDSAGVDDSVVGKFLAKTALTDNGWVDNTGPMGDLSYEDAYVSARLISTTCQ